ncbi:hypothetical protein B9Z34_02980 [Limnohabitans sp. Hippo3]|nr:hypothetical protein B9Z34_02980 [Limnohabitans sp. Hippo3]
MSANMPDSPANLPSGSEPLLANANQASTPSGLPPPSAAGAASHRAPYRKSGLGIAAALLLAITFWLYAKPDVIIMLSEQLWSCF